MRKCKNENCDFEGRSEDFPLANTIKGKKYYRHVCNECYRKQKAKQRINRTEEFLEYKKTLECERCGFDDYRALEFHHKNEKDKNRNVSNMSSQGWSMKKIMKEVEKCEVLCANCHRIEHYRNN